jgi:hypothetical protein
MTNFIPDGSPLLNPPSSLALKQRVAVDGIRLALDMLAAAWDSLTLELTALSQNREAPLTRSCLSSIYTSAWIVIDVIHRLRLFLIALPGLKRSPEVELAIREFAEVRPLRDGFQHVDKQLHSAAARAWPLWGSISWVWSPPETLNVRARVFTLVLGGIRDGEVPTLNPLGHTVSIPLGMITVNAFGRSLELSKYIQRVHRVASYIDSALRQIPNPEGGMADVLLSVDVVFGAVEDTQGPSAT